MTAPAENSTSAMTWVAAMGLIALVVVVLVFGQDDDTNQRALDPRSTGRDGLKALRLLIDESGGSASLDVSEPSDEHDVAILATNAYVDVWAELQDRDDQTEELFAPILAWVEQGGVLVTGVDVPGGPATTFDQELSDEDFESADLFGAVTVVARQTCTDRIADGVGSIEVRSFERAEVGAGDTSCYGSSEVALVVQRGLGSGQIIRVGTFSAFTNQSLDEQDNAALAARLLDLSQDRRIAFLSGPDGSGPSPFGGPLNEDGRPVGGGDQTLVDLVPSKVWAMLAGLAVAAVLYALASGRRLGRPVLEPLPIELPSSSYVEAVGRLYGRVGGSRERTSRRLRQDFVASMAPRVGLPSSCSYEQLASALDPDADSGLHALLLRPEPSTEEGVQNLARELNEARLFYEQAGSVLSTTSTPTTTQGLEL